MVKKVKSSGIWGGRFSGAPADIMEQINASIDVDKRLYAQDIQASVAHCKMLASQGIITQSDAESILNGLAQIKSEIENGAFDFKRALEDIHMNIESRLAELIGDAAGRLHTARSRNDQVAVDFRLWVRDALERLDGALAGLQKVLLDRASQHAETLMPGFTHLQTAQPVTLGHHLLAYVEMIGRDRGRAADCKERLNECPLGSAALAGTPFPIDRQASAEALVFARPTANSLDSVSDRDFALEYLSLAAICMVHLSRLAEELVIWSSAPFSFVVLPDSFSTGSSIMPQKRNPDAAELVRAKTGRVIGDLNQLLVVMKGLPLAYSKDMQEDKEPVFDAADTLELCLAAMTGMIAELGFDADRMAEAAQQGYSTATDLADWLVRVLGLPFRQAHHVTGALVKVAEDGERPLDRLSLKEMQAVEPRITEDVFSVLSIEASVAGRTAFGGTAPSNVRAAVAQAKKRFLKE